MKEVMAYLNIFRKYLRARQYVMKFKTVFLFIKDELQSSIETDISHKNETEKYFG